MKKIETNIFWFRRDLRLEDNKGLYFALRSGKPVLPIFIFDSEILSKLKNPEDARVTFIHDQLMVMKEKLNEMGNDLYVLHDTPENAWNSLLEKFQIDEVFTNEDYEPYAIKRDNKIGSLLKKNNIKFNLYKDHTIFAKDEVLKKDGKPYTVYTPYKNKWYETLTPSDLNTFSCKGHFKNLLKTKKSKMPSMDSLGFKEHRLMDVSFKIDKKVIENYHETRNFPAVHGTSLLGAHLRFGLVSVRKCAQVAYELNRTWLDELIWRDFFAQILFHFPHVVKAPFRDKYSKIEWRNNKTEFKKWCEGKTGYPMVDAGMRELNETGFMHNRVRMIAASFLIKHLLIDWRWGEKYFAEKLMDFDLSANNGNWQWVAGSGCDAAPYFRIFNPITQLKKFDPDWDYVRKWVPEVETPDYVAPMVEHSVAYHRALSTYKKALGGAAK